VTQLDEIPGIGVCIAQEIIAEIGVGNSILTIAYHLLSDPDARFTDLGADHPDRLAPQRRKRHLIRELERLSDQKVTLEEVA
jgi:transposase